MYRIYIWILILFSIKGYIHSTDDFSKISFDESMKRGEEHLREYDIRGTDFGDKYIELYERNMPFVLIRQEKTKIPKIIHQIWLGSPLPQKFKKLQASWIKMHPEWTYILWTDRKALSSKF